MSSGSPRYVNGIWVHSKKRSVNLQTWRDQTISETMDGSSTKMEIKWAKDMPTQRHTAHDNRKTQIYAYSNAENILLSIECTHVDKRMFTLINATEHMKLKHIHTRTLARMHIHTMPVD